MRAWPLILFGVMVSGAAICAPVSPWLIIGISAPDGRETTKIEVSTVEIANAAGALPEISWIDQKSDRVWVAKKVVMRAGAPTSILWADSRTCYPLIETLATLVDLDRPQGGPETKALDVPASGAAYRLVAAGLALGSSASELQLVGGRTQSAHVFVQNALAAWVTCWSASAPQLTGRPS